jgi:hypothetical protein
MVAMVRHALAIDQKTKVRPTPLTELVQIRVTAEFPRTRANHGDFSEQESMNSSSTARALAEAVQLSGAAHGRTCFGRSEMSNPFERNNPARRCALKTCIQCHQGPGIC